jgi:hypothetical protein
MRTLVWMLAWASVALWSLVAWMGHGLVGFAGDVVADNADVAPVTPEGVELLSGLVDWIAWAGQGAVVAVWAIGALAILAAAAVVVRLLGGRGTPARRATDGAATTDVRRWPSSRQAPGGRLSDAVRAIAERRPIRR